MEFIFIIFSILLTQFSFAQSSLTVVAVGEAEIEQDKIYFELPSFDGLSAKESSEVKNIISILKADFDFYRHVFNVDTDKTSTRFLVESNILRKNDQLEMSFKVQDKGQDKVTFEGKRTLDLKKVRKSAHAIANDIYQSITGKKSIFDSKIIFVSDRTSSGRDVKKEIYTMDFDGENKKRITYLNSMVIAPSISPDNDKIAFTLVETQNKKSSDGKSIQRVKNLNLYMMDLKTKSRNLISSVAGINSGAVFSRDGKSIYMTLSHLKNADIYKLDLATGKRRRVTTHFSDDVDPHINSDESLMTFLSGRPGKAMIYTADPSGTEKDVKRISFVGRFNAAPRFNPEGSEIVFSSWVDDRFDIYRIGSDGRNLVRLTKNFGSNEEPWFSPDGQFIVFTSQRVITRKTAVQDVYIMNREGEVIKRISENFGKIYTPRWSN